MVIDDSVAFILEAEPCVFDDETGGLMGFFTTRFVKAESWQSAEAHLWKKWEKDRIIHTFLTSDEISLSKVEVREVHQLSGRPKQAGLNPFRTYAGKSFTFYPDDGELL